MTLQSDNEQEKLESDDISNLGCLFQVLLGGILGCISTPAILLLIIFGLIYPLSGTSQEDPVPISEFLWYGSWVTAMVINFFIFIALRRKIPASAIAFVLPAIIQSLAILFYMWVGAGLTGV